MEMGKKLFSKTVKKGFCLYLLVFLGMSLVVQTYFEILKGSLLLMSSHCLFETENTPHFCVIASTVCTYRKMSMFISTFLYAFQY